MDVHSLTLSLHAASRYKPLIVEAPSHDFPNRLLLEYHHSIESLGAESTGAIDNLFYRPRAHGDRYHCPWSCW